MNDYEQIPYPAFSVVAHNDVNTTTLEALKNQYVNEDRYSAGLSLDKVFWPELSAIIQQSKKYSIKVDEITISFINLSEDNKNSNMFGNTPQPALSFSVRNNELSSNLSEIKRFFNDNDISLLKETADCILIDIDGDENTNVAKIDNLIKRSNDHSTEHTIEIDNSTSSSKQPLFQHNKQASYGATETVKPESKSWWSNCGIL